MKVSRLVAVALVASACSRDPGVAPTPAAEERAVETPTPEPPAPRPAAAATTGTVATDARAAADGPFAQAAEQAGKNVPAAILADFKTRIDDYIDIRKRADRDAPPLKETADAGKIQAAQEARGAAIRALRKGAKPGDIFTPEIRHTFRQLLAPELRGDEGRDAKSVLRDDAPAPGAVPLEVNAKYPEGVALPTVPASLLANLPQLPKGIEYRIIGKDLVLLDSDANLILDFIRNAIK